MLSLMLAALTLAAERKSTGVQDFSRTTKWSIFQSYKDDTCIATTYYTGGTELNLHWHPRNNRLAIFYSDPVMQSLVDGKDYEVEVYFRRGGELDDGWGKRVAHASRTTEGTPEFFFVLPGKEALTDVAANDLIGVFYNDKVVASLKLKDSAAMVQQLRRCSVQVLANHPADPFEE